VSGRVGKARRGEAVAIEMRRNGFLDQLNMTRPRVIRVSRERRPVVGRRVCGGGGRWWNSWLIVMVRGTSTNTRNDARAVACARQERTTPERPRVYNVIPREHQHCRIVVACLPIL
jgi:hypothetical protein